jgi:RNA polymerase sigma-70 factor, ECF subfamily
MSSAACAADDALSPEQLRIDQAFAGCQRQLYPAALELTGNLSDAESLVQETMARACAAFRWFVTGANGCNWLLRLMASTFARSQPAGEPEQAPVARADCGLASAAVGRPILTDRTAPSAEDAALAELTRSQVRQALAELPAGFRVTVYLVDAEGYSYRQAAEQTGVPIGTVMSRLYRARNRLRQQLEPRLRLGPTTDSVLKQA